MSSSSRAMDLDETLDDSEVDSYPKELYCTICVHEMKHPTYKVCSHPLLMTPLCILCFDKVSERLEEENQAKQAQSQSDDASISPYSPKDSSDEVEDEHCHWCYGDDDLTLFMCGDGTSCKHQFCSDCLKTNLGEAYLQEVEEQDIWTCLVCDDKPLEAFRYALEYGKKHSIYETLDITPTMDQEETAEGNEVHDEDIVVAKHIEILKNILHDLNEAFARLEPTQLMAVEKKIHQELLEANQVRNVESKTKEELETYTTDIETSIDIFQRQESECADVLEYYEVDLLSTGIYHVGEMTAQQENMYKDVDKLIQLKQIATAKDIGKITNTHDVRFPKHDIAFEDEDLPKSALFTELEVRAVSDEVVMKYDRRDDLPEKLYPISFEQLYPKTILKALYYATKKDSNTISDRYAIPRHIGIVLRHASKSYPEFSKYLDDLYLHPAILKAIFYEGSQADLVELCTYYDIDMNVAKITDFGDASDLVKEVQSRNAKTGKACELNLSEFLDAVENEEMDEEEEAKRKKTMQKIRQNNKTGRIEAVFHTQRAEEKEDEEDLAQERRSAARKVGTHVPTTRTRERRKNPTNRSTRTNIALPNPTNTENRSERRFLQLKRQKKVIQVVRLEDVDAHGNLLTRLDDTRSNGQEVMDVDAPMSTATSSNSAMKNEFMEVDEKGEMKVIADPWKIGNSRVASNSSSSSNAVEDEDVSNTTVQPNMLQPRSVVAVCGQASAAPQELAKLSLEKKNAKQILLDQLQAKIESRRLQELSNNSSSRGNEVRVSSSMPPPPPYTQGGGSSAVIQGKNSYLSQEKRPFHQPPGIPPRSIPSGTFVDLTEDDDEAVDAAPSLTTSKSGAYWNTGGNSGNSLKAYYASTPSSKSAPPSAQKGDNGSSSSSSSSNAKEEEAMEITMSADWRAEEEAMINTLGEAGNKKGKQDVVSQETKDAINMELQRKREMDLHKHFIQDESNRSVINPKRPEGEHPVLLVSSFVDKLKDHQVEGIRFIWENIAGSIQSLRRSHSDLTSFGCLLAHCMGLGKSFTTISFLVSMLTNPEIRGILDPSVKDACNTAPIASIASHFDSQDPDGGNSQGPFSPGSPQPNSLLGTKRLFHRIAIVAPKNTLQNWELEIRKWTPKELLASIPIYTLLAETNKQKGAGSRSEMMKNWFERGGILIMSYQLFRILVDNSSNSSNANNANNEAADNANSLYRSYLVNPGPDLVIADEAHMIKNSKSKVTKAFLEIRTKRRIALTGSPLQNNLEEYWCMVDWVKRRYLYSFQEYKQRFIEPIKKGESKDANPFALREMKKRTYVLHKKLESIVHRKDMTDLAQFLPPKREFVLSIRMTSYQKFLYKYYISMMSQGAKFLFRAYQSLLRIWNHPCCAILHSHRMEAKEAMLLQQQAALNNNSEAVGNKRGRGRKSLDPSTAIAKPNVEDMRKTIKSSYEHFLHQSKEVLEAIDRAAERVEEHMMPTDMAVDRDSPTGYGEEDLLVDHGGMTEDDANFVVPDDYVEYEDRDDAGLVSKRSRLDDEGSSSSSSSRKYRRALEHTIEEVLGEDLEDDELMLLDHNGEQGVADDSLLQSSATLPLAAAKVSKDGEGVEIDLTDEDSVDVAGIPHDWWKFSDNVFDHDATSGSDHKPIRFKQLIQMSNKMITLLSLLAMSVEAGDKMIVFSQNLYTLDLIEMFLGTPRWGNIAGIEDEHKILRFNNWKHKTDYLRIDGTTNNRQRIIDEFNEKRYFKLMLISTRAGNMGINLQSANRVVLFDTSWNPVNDLQAIYRAYRFGQKKPVFVYRLVASGSMEEKIYRKQVVKQALAARVVDAQMPENQFTDQESAELLQFNDEDVEGNIEKAQEIVSKGTVDLVLQKFIKVNGTQMLVSIEDSDTLLADREDAHLNEYERKAAEDEFERESLALKNHRQYGNNNKHMAPPVAANPSGGAVANAVSAMAGTALTAAVTAMVGNAMDNLPFIQRDTGNNNTNGSHDGSVVADQPTEDADEYDELYE